MHRNHDPDSGPLLPEVSSLRSLPQAKVFASFSLLALRGLHGAGLEVGHEELTTLDLAEMRACRSAAVPNGAESTLFRKTALGDDN
jgi:hypothetical protein